MSAFEQRVEAADKAWQYLLFAADPYETVAFKIPARKLRCGCTPACSSQSTSPFPPPPPPHRQWRWIATRLDSSRTGTQRGACSLCSCTSRRRAAAAGVVVEVVVAVVGVGVVQAGPGEAVGLGVMSVRWCSMRVPVTAPAVGRRVQVEPGCVGGPGDCVVVDWCLRLKSTPMLCAWPLRSPDSGGSPTNPPQLQRDGSIATSSCTRQKNASSPSSALACLLRH